MNARRSLIASHLALIEEWKSKPWASADRREVLRKLNDQVPELNRILSELGPDHGRVTRYVYAGERPVAPHALSRALDLLDQADSFTAEGKVAGIPAFPMIFFHPLVAGPAQPLFEAQKYRQGVNDAATHVNDALQKRLGRYDISDAELMGKAFTTDPPKEGQPRLRCPGDQKNLSIKSQQEGAAPFAIGVFKAIRNPAHHLPGDWNPVIAFEYLGSLSTLARWVTEWAVAYYRAPVQTVTLEQQEAAIARLVRAKKP